MTQSRVPSFCKKGAARLWEGKGTGKRRQPNSVPISNCKKGQKTPIFDIGIVV